MDKGIVLLAHCKIKYLQMAWNLAHLLRARGTTLPICLVTDTDWRLPKPLPFDLVVKMDKEDNHPFYAKTRLNKYTPFDRTLYIDCDSFPVKSLDDLFDNEDPFQIQVQNQNVKGFGPNHKFQWAVPETLYEFYRIAKTNPWTETNSSFMLWTKGDYSDRIFAVAEHCYASDFYPGYARNIGYYPDELAFNVALSALGIAPTYQRPIYFCDPIGTPLQFNAIGKAHHMAGLYGNDTTTHSHLWRHYHSEVVTTLKAHIGKYGFKIHPSDKAANGGTKRPKWEGLRNRVSLQESGICNKIETTWEKNPS